MPVGEAFKPRSSALMVPVLRSSSFFGAGLYAADHIQALSKPLYVLQEHSIPSILMGLWLRPQSDPQHEAWLQSCPPWLLPDL